MTHILVVANQSVATPALLEEIERRSASEACEISLLIPDAADGRAGDWTLRHAVRLIERTSGTPVRGVLRRTRSVRRDRRGAAGGHLRRGGDLDAAAGALALAAPQPAAPGRPPRRAGVRRHPRRRVAAARPKGWVAALVKARRPGFRRRSRTTGWGVPGTGGRGGQPLRRAASLARVEVSIARGGEADHPSRREGGWAAALVRRGGPGVRLAGERREERRDYPGAAERGGQPLCLSVESCRRSAHVLSPKGVNRITPRRIRLGDDARVSSGRRAARAVCAGDAARARADRGSRRSRSRGGPTRRR